MWICPPENAHRHPRQKKITALVTLARGQKRQEMRESKTLHQLRGAKSEMKEPPYMPDILPIATGENGREAVTCPMFSESRLAR